MEGGTLQSTTYPSSILIITINKMGEGANQNRIEEIPEEDVKMSNIILSF